MNAQPIKILSAALATCFLLATPAAASEHATIAEPSAQPAAEAQPIISSPPELPAEAPREMAARAISKPAAAPVSKEARAAYSKDAEDMKGVEPSLYQGEYYMPKRGEGFRRCVINRESKGHYTAANATSSARGAYQFLDNAWREPLVHMLRKEAKKNGLTEQLKKLEEKPIHKWSRYWQDAAFWTVLNYEAPLSGAKHWGSFGQTYSCR